MRTKPNREAPSQKALNLANLLSIHQSTSIFIFIRDDKMFLFIRHAIIIYRLLYHFIFIEIERKIEIKTYIAKNIVKKIFLRVEIDNFLKILICVNNFNKNKLFRINDNNLLSKKTRNIIFKHFYILFEKIVNNEKKIYISLTNKKLLKNFFFK